MEIGLLDGKSLIKQECLQSTFKNNNSVTTVDIEWYRVPDGGCGMSKLRT